MKSTCSLTLPPHSFFRSLSSCGIEETLRPLCLASLYSPPPPLIFLVLRFVPVVRKANPPLVLPRTSCICRYYNEVHPFQGQLFLIPSWIRCLNLKNVLCRPPPPSRKHVRYYCRLPSGNVARHFTQRIVSLVCLMQEPLPKPSVSAFAAVYHPQTRPTNTVRSCKYSRITQGPKPLLGLRIWRLWFIEDKANETCLEGTVWLLLVSPFHSHLPTQLRRAVTGRRWLPRLDDVTASPLQGVGTL
jgi:hypothetical protein